MRVAVALEGNTVSEHFGHCEKFFVADIENGQITNQMIVENPEHVPGFLPEFLAGKDVNCVITGGIGARAVQLFSQKNIAVISGARGTADEVLDLYLKGKLVSTGSVCSDHMHAGECGGHQ
ncbi:NifB/NifX family molybdenum-iron cluster-binding protein [Phosphitispora sp. TUW77]|uniref:NifB/NifX family molybdenum-iron cluster-binding protein n=1 Tax=Phosphitispora sp. TUW77 TaxID=3152361 RepID=UPI003AB8E330